MNCLWPLSCAMSASLRPRCRSRASRFLPRFRAEESSLLHCQNLENCQGTSVFLLLLFSKSTKLSRLYLACFQSSAARPQATARILCNRSPRDFQPPHSCNIFAVLIQRSIPLQQISRGIELCEIGQKASPARLSEKYDFGLSAVGWHSRDVLFVSGQPRIRSKISQREAKGKINGFVDRPRKPGPGAEEGEHKSDEVTSAASLSWQGMGSKAVEFPAACRWILQFLL